LIPCSPKYDLEILTLFFELQLYCYRYKYLVESRFQVFVVEVTVHSAVTVDHQAVNNECAVQNDGEIYRHCHVYLGNGTLQRTTIDFVVCLETKRRSQNSV